MSAKTKCFLITLFWIFIILIPVISCLIVITQFSADAQIPIHWNARHQVDRYGSPWEIFPSSLLIATCETLLAIFMYLAISYLIMDLFMESAERQHVRLYAEQQYS